MEKIYYVYKFSGNPDPVATCAKLKEVFGEGYVFDEVHPGAEAKYGREGIRELFNKEMREGGFTKIVVDVSFGFGRFMKEEIALAKELGIGIVEVDLRRMSLPYRKNCEGYFFREGKVLAQDTGKGYVLFPGGGIDEGEDPEDAILRETVEETGAVINNLKKVGMIRFDWGPDWAKTDKQKMRYENFRGEEMHLFSGEVGEMKEASGDGEESGWDGEVLTTVEDVIDLINSYKPFPETMKEYYSVQLEKMKEMVE